MTTQTTPAPVTALGRSDTFLAAAVVGIVAMMIVPLPPTLLDILIVLNITFSLTILLVSLNIREPLEFSSFPPLLLIATLFRLGLNVSAARLVLLNAHAGEVINAFGKVVVGGNTIVGIVVFLILVVIQYVVITNGAGRVSEVAARFTLDAMPGKQMSIDADLNAGLITPDEARARRHAIERESDFYGAMDGASKFVKGDAVAALVIIVVNIVGGLTVGVMQKGYDIGMALTTYTVLTVGDGLVNEISALLVSVATGVLVTRSGSEAGLGSDLGAQLLSRPRLFMVVGGVLFVIGVVPGFPTFVFCIGGALVAGGGWFLSQSATAAALVAAAAAPVVTPALPALGSGQESPLDALKVETMELEVGYGLVGLVEGGASGGLVERIGLIRRQIAGELGLIVPTVRIRDDLVLDQNSYVIKLRGSEIARGSVDPTKMLCMDPNGGEIAVSGIPTSEPVFGLPASWVSVAERERAESMGYTVVDAASVMATHLAETIRRHAYEILGRPETSQLLDGLKHDQPGLVEEIIPSLVSVGRRRRRAQHQGASLPYRGGSARAHPGHFDAISSAGRGHTRRRPGPRSGYPSRGLGHGPARLRGAGAIRLRQSGPRRGDRSVAAAARPPALPADPPVHDSNPAGAAEPDRAPRAAAGRSLVRGDPAQHLGSGSCPGGGLIDGTARRHLDSPRCHRGCTRRERCFYFGRNPRRRLGRSGSGGRRPVHLRGPLVGGLFGAPRTETVANAQEARGS
jgi:flagellar biosynthesis protein FlhA